MAPYAVHRDVLVTENYARTDFRLQRQQCRKLCLGELAHLSLAVVRVLNSLLRKLRDSILYLRRCKL